MAMLNRRIGVLEKRARTAAAMPAAACGGGPLTGEELAGRLGITGETVRRWAAGGMPSCGTHPSRPSWPVYDEAACRGWAAANQPQTPLRPAAGDGVGAAPEGDQGESLADLRAKRLRLQCQLMRMRLVDRRDRLLDADAARSVMKRHADVVRARVGRVPARAVARLVERYAVDEEGRAGLEAILAAEISLVLAEVKDDPLSDPASGSRAAAR